MLLIFTSVLLVRVTVCVLSPFVAVLMLADGLGAGGFVFNELFLQPARHKIRRVGDNLRENFIIKSCIIDVKYLNIKFLTCQM